MDGKTHFVGCERTHGHSECACRVIDGQATRIKQLEKGYDELKGICGKQKAVISRLSADNTALRAAAQTVIDRWDSPTWKHAEATAVMINKLRAALARGEQQ